MDADAAQRIQAVTGLDVSHAVVHDGPVAKEAANALGARGYTLGADVVVADSAREVLLHELGHVAQQSGRETGMAAADRPAPMGDLEAQADAVAEAAAAGGPTVSVAGAAQTLAFFTKPQHTYPDDGQVATLEGFCDEVGRIINRKSEETRRSGKAKKLKRKTGHAQALGIMVSISEYPDLTAPVVQQLDSDDSFSELLRVAGFQNIWQDEQAADATMALIGHRDPGKARRDIEDLVLWQREVVTRDIDADGKQESGGTKKQRLDITVNRWEARLVWELLKLLPKDERANLMEWTADEEADYMGTDRSEREDSTRLERRLSKAVGNGRVDRNLSMEYRESSRYDTYEGEEGKTVELEEKDAQGEVSATHEVATTEDTDNQSLRMQAMSPETWADKARLIGVLRMLVNAGEADCVVHQVSSHWEEHKAELAALGFAADGTWKEVIIDATATTWFTRFTSGITAVGDVLGALFATKKVKARKGIDLQALANGLSMFSMGSFTGVRFEETNKKTARETVNSILGGPGHAKKVLGFLGMKHTDLFEYLKVADHAGVALIQALDSVDTFVEGGELLMEAIGIIGKDNDAKADQGADKGEDAVRPASNDAILSDNDLTGALQLRIDNLPLEAIVQRNGDQVIKVGNASIQGLVIEVKSASPLSRSRHVSMRLSKIRLDSVIIMDGDSMMTLDGLELLDLNITLKASDKRPASYVEQVAFAAQAVAAQTLHAVPLKALSGTGLGAIRDSLGLAAEVIQTGSTITEILGDWTDVHFGFQGLTLESYNDSSGNHSGAISVGETEMDVNVLSGNAITGGYNDGDLLLGKGGDLAHIKPGAHRDGKSTKERELEKVQRQKARKSKNGKDIDGLAELEAKLTAELDAGGDALTPEFLQRKLDRYTKRLGAVEGRLADMDGAPDGRKDNKAHIRRKQSLEDKRTYYAEEIERLQKAISQAQRIKPLQRSMAPLNKQLATLEADLAAAKKDGADTAELEAEIKRVKRELLPLRIKMGSEIASGAKASGKVGEVTANDLDFGGVAVEKLHFSGMAFGEGAAKDQNATLTADGITIGGDRRRDVAIEQEVVELQNALRAIDPKLTDSEQATNKDDLDKRISQLVQELDLLQPVIAEYEALRGQLDTLSPDEQERLFVLKKQLEQPAGVTVKKAEASNIQLTPSGKVNTLGNFGGDNDLSGVQGGMTLSADIDVTDASYNETALFSHGGNTTVGKVDIDGLKVGASSDSDGLHARAGMDHAEVSDIRMQGEQSAVESRRERLQLQLTAAQTEFGKLDAKAQDTNETLTALDQTRMTALQEQIQQYQDGLLSLGTPDYSAYIAAYQAKAPGMSIGSGGKKVSQARGATMQSLKGRLGDLAVDVAKLRNGDAKSPYPLDEQACVKTCKARIEEYSEGVRTLTLRKASLDVEAIQLALMIPDISPSEQDGLALSNARTNLTTAKARSKAVEADITAGEAELVTWEKKLESVNQKIRVLEKTQSQVRRVRATLAELVAVAESCGLDREKLDADPQTLSAFAIRQRALAAQEGLQDMTIGSVVADGVDVKIDASATALSPLLDTDDETTGVSGDLEVSGGGDKGQLVESLTVNDVRRGDKALVKSLSVKDIGGGATYNPSTNAIVLDEFSVGSVALGQLDWNGGFMGVACDSPLTIEGVKVSGEIDASTFHGTLSVIGIDQVSAADLTFRYEDYIIGLGDRADQDALSQDTPVAASATTITGVTLENLDLTTYNFERVDIVSLDAKRLSADLGQGMTIGAGSLSGDLSVETVGTNLDHFKIGSADLSASDTRVRMKEMGLDLKVKAIDHASLGNIDVNMETGIYQFRDIAVPGLKLGPIRYDAGGMLFESKSSMALTTVHLSGQYGPDPDGTVNTHIDRFKAKTVATGPITFRSQDPTGTTDIELDSASMTDLELTGYDLNSGEMGVSLSNGDLDGLVANLDGSELKGSFDVDALSFKTLKDSDGKDAMELGFKGLSSDGEVTYDSDTESDDGTYAKLNSLNNASAETVHVGAGQTTFSGVKLDDLQLDTLDWRDGTTSIEGTLVDVSNVLVDGYTESRERESGGMRLPVTDLYLTNIHVDTINGMSMAYGDDENYVRFGGMQVGDAEAFYEEYEFQIEDINVTDLQVIDGVATGGLATIEEVSGRINANVGQLLSANTDLRAGRITCSFMPNGAINTKVNTIHLTNADVTKVFETGSSLNVVVPDATISGLDASYLSSLKEGDKAAVREDMLDIVIPDMWLNKPATFTFEAAPGSDQRDKRADVVDSDGAITRHGDYTTDDKFEALVKSGETTREFQKEHFKTLLESVSGEITFDLDTNLRMGLTGYDDLSVQLENGQWDYSALEDSIGGASEYAMDIEWEDLDSDMNFNYGDANWELQVNADLLGDLGWNIRKWEFTQEEGKRYEKAGQVPLYDIIQKELEGSETAALLTWARADNDPDHDAKVEASRQALDAVIVQFEAAIARLELIHGVQELPATLDGEVRDLAIALGTMAQQEDPTWGQLWSAATMPDMEPEELIIVLKATLDVLKHAGSYEDELSTAGPLGEVRLGISDMHADLQLGDGGKTEVKLGDGKVLRYGQLDIDLAQTGESNVFSGQFAIQDLGYESYAEDGSRSTVDVGSGNVGGIAELLRYGIIPVGGIGDDPYANPIRGALGVTTELHGVHINNYAKHKVNK